MSMLIYYGEEMTQKNRWLIHSIDAYVRFPNYPGNIENLPKEKFWIGIDFDIGHQNSQATNVFGLEIVTTDYLVNTIVKNEILIPKYLVIVKDYSEEKIVNFVNKLLDQCAEKDWNSTCKALSFYMSWEYDDSIALNY